LQLKPDLARPEVRLREVADRYDDGHDRRRCRESPGERAAPRRGGGLVLMVHGRLVIQESPDITDVPEPLAWIFLEAAPERPPNLDRSQAQIRLVSHDSGDRFGDIVAFEGAPAGDHLEED